MQILAVVPIVARAEKADFTKVVNGLKNQNIFIWLNFSGMENDF